MLSRLKVAFPRKPARGDVLLISPTGAYNPTFFASDWTYMKRRDSYREIFSLDGA